MSAATAVIGGVRQGAALRRSPAGVIQMLAAALLLVLVIVLTLRLVGQIDRAPPTLLQLERSGVSSVQNWNWFNNALEAPVARQQQVAQALADAKINADLLGVVISDEISTATIKYKGQPEAVYLRGDDLLAGMKIVKIEAQRIVVEQGGVQKQILLKKPESIFQSEVVSENSNSDLEQSGFRLANMFGAVPVRLASGGGAETAGFKLNGLSAEMRSLADIEDGDVVVSVSGSSVTELMENPAAWMSLSGQSNLPLTIIRDGQEMVIYVNAASLSAKMLPMMGKIR